jgi:hypothetical protein
LSHNDQNIYILTISDCCGQLIHATRQSNQLLIYDKPILLLMNEINSNNLNQQFQLGEKNDTTIQNELYDFFLFIGYFKSTFKQT